MSRDFGVTDILFRKRLCLCGIIKNACSPYRVTGPTVVHLKHCSSRACEGFELVPLLDVWGAVRFRQRDSCDLLTLDCLISAVRDSKGEFRFLAAFMQFGVGTFQ